MSTSPTTQEALAWDLLDRLAKALRVSGVSKAAMAEELGVSGNTVGNYLSGRTHPSRATVKVWALRCGVPYEWLAYGTAPDQGPGAPSGLVNPASPCMSDVVELYPLLAAA